MKGAVFIALNDMIETQYGIETWDELLEEVNPENNGIYTAVEDYPDEDVVKFVLAISDKLGLPSSDVTRIFGEYLFADLNGKHPIFSKISEDLFSFLESIESVIHKEVRKLFDNPNLPTLSTSREENALVMKYVSPRKLCYLAEGLIFGAANYYGESIYIEHDTCMHKGSDHCLLRVVKNE